MTGPRKHRIIRLLLERDGQVCWICRLPLKPHDGEKRKRKATNGAHGNLPLATTLDHVDPRKNGGHSEVENLRLAHKICNTTRGHADLTEELREVCRERVLGVRIGIPSSH